MKFKILQLVHEHCQNKREKQYKNGMGEILLENYRTNSYKIRQTSSPNCTEAHNEWIFRNSTGGGCFPDQSQRPTERLCGTFNGVFLVRFGTKILSSKPLTHLEKQFSYLTGFELSKHFYEIFNRFNRYLLVKFNIPCRPITVSGIHLPRNRSLKCSREIMFSPKT